MLHVVQISEVCFLDYSLSVEHNVAHKHQKSKIQLKENEKVMKSLKLTLSVYPYIRQNETRGKTLNLEFEQ